MSSDVPLPEGWTKNVSKSTGSDKLIKIYFSVC